LDAMTEHALDLVGLVNLVGGETRPDQADETNRAQAPEPPPDDKCNIEH